MTELTQDEREKRMREAVAILVWPVPPKTHPEALRKHKSVAVAAAKYLWGFYEDEYGEKPDLHTVVWWWWKAARRVVDIPNVCAGEMREVWKHKERGIATDLTKASPNAFFAYQSFKAACYFVSAKGYKGNDPETPVMLRSAGFDVPEVDTSQIWKTLATAESVE